MLSYICSLVLNYYFCGCYACLHMLLICFIVCYASGLVFVAIIFCFTLTVCFLVPLKVTFWCCLVCMVVIFRIRFLLYRVISERLSWYCCCFFLLFASFCLWVFLRLPCLFCVYLHTSVAFHFKASLELWYVNKLQIF